MGRMMTASGRSLKERQQVEYEIVTDRGKQSAGQSQGQVVFGSS
jgi:hypothetical protein